MTRPWHSLRVSHCLTFSAKLCRPWRSRSVTEVTSVSKCGAGTRTGQFLCGPRWNRLELVGTGWNWLIFFGCCLIMFDNNVWYCIWMSQFNRLLVSILPRNRGGVLWANEQANEHERTNQQTETQKWKMGTNRHWNELRADTRRDCIPSFPSFPNFAGKRKKGVEKTALL